MSKDSEVEEEKEGVREIDRQDDKKGRTDTKTNKLSCPQGVTCTIMQREPRRAIESPHCLRGQAGVFYCICQPA